MLLASSVAYGQSKPITLQENAPDRYVVVPGDTLWAIAGRFIKDPWRWPEIWKLNRDQIRNPHLIYPGNVVVLDRSGGSPQLRMLEERTVRLTPQARTEELEGRKAIPSIPPSAIEPFLSQPVILDQASITAAPRIVAMQENRVVIGAGNIAYAKGIAASEGKVWHVYRPAGNVVDPDTNEALGFEALYLGEAQVLREGDTATLQITKAREEIHVGDRLLPAPKLAFSSYAPRPPEKQVKSRIIAAYGQGINEVGPGQIVTLNKGTRDGVEAGHVLALYRSASSSRNVFRNEPMYGRAGLFQLRKYQEPEPPMSGVRNTPLWGRQGPTGDDPSIKPTEPTTDLPDERYGLLFVFRTFDRLSYALVMQASRPVNVLDFAQNP